MVRVIYVARHGLRANEAPPPTGIAGDVPISDEGEEQAAELAHHLAGVVPPVQRIYCSPFYRCLQTAEAASRLLSLPIHVDPGLGEFFVVERPTHPVPLPAAASKRFFPSIDLAYEGQPRVTDAGETKEQFYERVRRAVDAIAAVADVDAVLIATHAAVKIAIAELLTGQTVRAGTCSLDTHVRTAAGWRCEVNGDTSYLRGGEQMNWDFGMLVEAGSVEDERRRARAKVLVAVEAPAAPSTGAPALPLELQLADLDTDRPLARVGSQVYEGLWTDMVGTEVYVTPKGQCVGKTRTRLVLRPAAREGQRGKLVDRIRAIDEARAS